MVRVLERMSRDISIVVAVLSSLCTLALAATITLDVASRIITGGSIGGLVELSETLLVAIVFFGVSYAAYTGGHVSMNLVTNVLPERVAATVRALAYILVLAFLLWLIQATGARATESFMSGEYQFGLTHFPLWPARWMIVVGLVACLPAIAFHLSTNFSRALNKTHNTPIADTEQNELNDNAV